MKVASLFGKRSERKNAESFIQQSKQTSQISSSESKISQMNSSYKISQVETNSSIPNNDKQSKSRYIFAAINKAEERKYIQDQVKNKRHEREIQKWEKEHEELLKFSNDSKVKMSLEDDENPQQPTLSTKEEEIKGKQIIMPSEEEFELMRQRYFKRLEATGILQFPKSKKAQIELLHYPEICGVPVITE